MSPEEDSGSPTVSSSRRLAGWKDISSHLERSVRTVQRWEREGGLPVHRYPTPRGEAVFALPEELDAWLRAGGPSNRPPQNVPGREVKPDPTGSTDSAAQMPSPPEQGDGRGLEAPPRRGRSFVLPLAAVIAIVAITALATVWLARPGSRPSPQPTTVKAFGQEVTALDSAGERLWTYMLDYAASDSTTLRQGTIVRDLDGDGRREAVIPLIDTSIDNTELLCLDSDGRRRWSRRPDRRARFGFGLMAPPWMPARVMATNDDTATNALWVAWVNRPWFGAFVERLDVRTGEPEAVFWSAGHVTAITVGKIGGRSALFVGAANNEHKAASLAVYDVAVIEGCGPAAIPAYACSDCPPGRPLAFFVFPKTEIGRLTTPETAPIDVATVMQDAAGQVVVFVQQAPWVADSGGGATVAYRFDGSLNLIGAETIDSYRMFHSQMERDGRLDHPFSLEEEKQMFPVLSWDGTKYVPIPGPQR